MSRTSNRASTVVAIFGIVLLVVLLVILWTSVRTTSIWEKETDQRSELQMTPSSGSNSLNENDQGTTVASGGTIFGRYSFNNEVTRNTEKISKEQDEFSTKPDVEYVTLMKLSQNQYEDPPEQFSTAKRHDSGHFRLATAEIWDPHPQYDFTAFGKRFRLRLTHDSSFVSPNIKITHMGANTTRREHPGHELGCFYSGTVDDDPNSYVTVNLCHGMTGYVKTSTGSYMIKPTRPWRGNDKDSLEFSLLHAIQRVRTLATDSNRFHENEHSSAGHNCGLNDGGLPTPIEDDTSDIRVYVGGRTRKRRALTEKKFLDDYQSEEKYEQFVGRRSEGRNFIENSERYKRYYSVERRRNDANEEYSQDWEMESDPFVTSRPRRALSGGYFIELMVVADAEMVKYHGDQLFSYILVLMSTVSRIYKDKSIGNAINISVMKIVQTDETFGAKQRGKNGIAADDMLRKFCDWQKHNNPHEPSSEHHDAALLLTRENLCHYQDQMRCDTLGLANLGRICYPGLSCAIVQDNGLAAAFTIAHEIGHVLNMPHDDDKVKCADFKKTTTHSNIMSRVLDNNTFPWEWSECSKHFVTEFLEAGHGSCLLDEPVIIMETDDVSRLAGEDYSANKQCELAFGEGFRLCTHMVADVCRRLWCTLPNWINNQCHTEHMPWSDGTPCGVNKWCYRGECVSRRILEPVDGQWGEWGEYGECSRTCGGGVQKKYRDCDNPPPENGGNYCVGVRVKYRSCMTEECPPGTLGFREVQCSNYDNYLRLPHLENAKWYVKYNRIPSNERCRLFCQVESNQYYALRQHVIDGTPCGRDTFHICVNGQCKPAGCDHVLDSTAELDVCGVCKGDNSTCQRITGSHNSTEKGYTRVTKIPAGSSNIDIRQRSWPGSVNDSIYLALRLGEGGEYILNGDHQVIHARVIDIIKSGITIEYSGSNTNVERLNSSRPIGTDLILEVLSVANYSYQVTYEYTVPKAILKSFTWVLSNWTACSHTCQGMKYRRAECRNTEHKDVVSDDYCREKERPREESQLCNNHCHLEWKITSVSECSNHCGPGKRTVTSRCMQILRNSEYHPRPIQEQACAHLQRPVEEACTGPCENVHWNYGEWDNCSVTCGSGFQQRTAVCVDFNGRPVAEENCAKQEKILRRVCVQSACPKWDYGKWGNCSVMCGRGTREKHYLCHVDSLVVPNSFCGEPPPRDIQFCNAGPCDEWQTSDWSSCSVTCGDGTKKRNVVCKSADGKTSNKCSPSDKPDKVTTCVLKPCPTLTNVAPIKYSSDPPHEDFSQQDNEVDDSLRIRFGYHWEIKPYKKCSKPCVDNFMRVEVHCVSIEMRNTVLDHYCDRKRKPSTIIPCNRHECPMWITGNWSKCTAECDAGFQHRQLVCRGPNGDDLPDEKCHDSEKPQIVKICQRIPCTSNSNNGRHQMETNIFRKWKVSNWSPCSAECGEGIQSRTVTCYSTNRHGLLDPVSNDNCPYDQKPPSNQMCKLRECDDEYRWSPGPWKKCNRMCGTKGRQTRRLFCHNKDGKKVARINCPEKFKPPRKRKCNQIKCHPTTCLEARKHYKDTEDRDYHLLVGRRFMLIYCHGMATSEPKEYLTLPAGFEENYAEIKLRRVTNHQSCSYNGQRNNSCHCATNSNAISGRTMFGRIRIDPVKLYILVSDYTFSRTEDTKRVNYGMVGDCYSRAYCSQGRFSINLNGTLLKLSSEVNWRSTPGTSMEINKISSQHVTGKCKGSCGFCNPKFGLKLDVLPP
ncbi:A disintegrin and metalloproteinase with thrombospondin motifs 15 isoform X2 [Nomia melanderi]|uniref:A disintegrin and metalloproteinase with thrombospondin motifs 15 isoform X2 n=1 Tax=Nomia melanderi TaxID=2448451 RepID=UPI0013042447|nr:A disintegrin and metalloproteinase with thrombospondin motifs 9-like isoform X2 [Nomia melanderi]